MNQNEKKLLHIQSKGWLLVTQTIMPRGGCWAFVALGQEWSLRVTFQLAIGLVKEQSHVGQPIAIGLSQPKVAVGRVPSWVLTLVGIVCCVRLTQPKPCLGLLTLRSCQLQSRLCAFVPTRFGAPQLPRDSHFGVGFGLALLRDTTFMFVVIILDLHF